MAKPSKPPELSRRWAVRLIRRHAELLGIVYAPDEAAAIMLPRRNSNSPISNASGWR
jgi:hypothetical protein